MIIECKTCSEIVNGVELASHFCGPTDEHLPVKWTFLKCPRCEDAMVAIQEDYGAGFEEDEPMRVYPAQDRRLGLSVPKPIRAAFDEATMCFRVKAYTASAIMCRKTLEGLCDQHEAKERTLSASLKKLREKGIIESSLFDWAEALRTLGNEAAHGVSTSITREDAQDTLEFTEALAQYVFTYRDQFERFKQRRSMPKTSITKREIIKISQTTAPAEQPVNTAQLTPDTAKQPANTTLA